MCRNIMVNFQMTLEAEALGGNSKLGNLDDVTPGKSICGDIFKNKGKSFTDL